MTPRERAFRYVVSEEGRKHLVIYEIGDGEAIDIIEGAILADRQALQSELVSRIQIEKAEASPGAWLALNAAIGIIQSVFAHQSQPEEIKPHQFQGSSDRWCEICNQPDRAAIHKIQSSYRNESLPLDQSARIAAMHKWLAEDAQIIQQLNESNLKLKEENEKLAQKLSSILDADGYSCRNCPAC